MSSKTKVEESFYFQFLIDRKCVKAGTKFRDATDLRVALRCFVKVWRSANIERDSVHDH